MKKTEFVDTSIGTVGDEQDLSFHGGGKTHPGACFPGGMVQLSPDTVTGGDNGTGYNYCHNTIEGFSFNHMSGIGWYGDLGNIQIMPITGETDLRSGSNQEISFEKGTVGWKSPFDHQREITKAGYYSVFLDRYNTYVEATATEHCGILKITYPEYSNKGLIFNLSRRIAGKADFQHIEIVNENGLEGFIECTPKGGGFGRGEGNISYNLYFVCEFSHPIKSYKFFSNEEYIKENTTVFEGEDVGLIVRFNEKTNEPILLKCGISYTDLDGARKNLRAECEDFNFESAKENTVNAWEKAFDCVEVEGDDETDLTLFYTCLYHTMLDPRTTLDTDHRFRNSKGEICNADYTHRTMFSGWDVYRSEFPLLTVLRPDIVNDEVNSLLNIAISKNSSFPRWELMGIDSGCMIGDPGLIVIADAYLKGIRNFDIRKAYDIALASGYSSETLYGKPFNSNHPKSKAYKESAYVSCDLSSTLEFLLADYCLAQFAKALGNTEDYEHFINRTQTYKNNYNKETGFLGAKDNNGEFIPVKDEYDTTYCTESNIFQQSWFVPYDIEGLCQLFGKERAIELLERLFANADLTALWNENYNHSNEPCHNLTHYFNILGLPHRTQYWTRRVQKEAYRKGAFGFCGNEDVGQLSAWYVLSALGFAQICPCDDKFHINTPLFKRAVINLDKQYHTRSQSEKFIIECNENPIDFPYIKEIYLNGEKIDRIYITYSEIQNGGELKFVLSKEP